MVVVRRFRLAIRSALVACALVLAAFVPTTASAATVTGNATWFDALGQPYGGCGLPQSALDSQNFVALNVFNTPGDPIRDIVFRYRQLLEATAREETTSASVRAIVGTSFTRGHFSRAV